MKETVQVLVVCGTNRLLYDHLCLQAADNALLKVFGFVDDMEELMEVSDLVIGKGGGLTVAESLARGKPLILFQSVPGQEGRNGICVCKYGAGLVAKSLNELVNKVSEILDSPEKLETMKQGVSRMAKPMASRDILELIQNEC